MIIGCFEVSELEPFKWLVKNTITGFEHRTYGTIEEIEPLLKDQTTKWEARKAAVSGKTNRLRIGMRRSIESAKHAKSKELEAKSRPLPYK